MTHADAGDTRWPRILVVDDDPFVLRTVVDVLSYDVAVVAARGGVEALHILRTDDAFDVIVCDLEMPIVDGNAVVAWLRRQDPPSDDRVVLMTRGARSLRTRAVVVDGQVRRLAKPLGIESLLRVVREIAHQQLRPRGEVQPVAAAS